MHTTTTGERPPLLWGPPNQQHMRKSTYQASRQWLGMAVYSTTQQHKNQLCRSVRMAEVTASLAAESLNSFFSGCACCTVQHFQKQLGAQTGLSMVIDHNVASQALHGTRWQRDQARACQCGAELHHGHTHSSQMLTGTPGHRIS
jgi:hypothetical protein